MEHSWAEHSGAGRTVPTINVGIWFAAIMFVLAVCFFRGVEDAGPYRCLRVFVYLCEAERKSEQRCGASGTSPPTEIVGNRSFVRSRKIVRTT